jgi:hypothetical protein
MALSWWASYDIIVHMKKISVQLSRPALLATCLLVTLTVGAALMYARHEDDARTKGLASSLEQIEQEQLAKPDKAAEQSAEGGAAQIKKDTPKDATPSTSGAAQNDATSDASAQNQEPVVHERKLLFSLPEVTLSSGNYSQPFSIKTDDGRAIRMPGVSTGKKGPFILMTNSYPSNGGKLATWTDVVVVGNSLGNPDASETHELYITVTDKDSSDSNESWHYSGYLTVVVEP